MRASIWYFCSIMWRLMRFRWVGARSWELAANSYGAGLTRSTQRTPQAVEMDPMLDTVERRSKCCIFVQKSLIIEQNHDFGPTVGHQKHNIPKKHRCSVKTPSSTCRNFWLIWNPTNIEWYLFWRVFAQMSWHPEELTRVSGSTQGWNLLHLRLSRKLDQSFLSNCIRHA